LEVNDVDKGGTPAYPNFFIVGAAKSGSTSLWMYLKQHPDIFMPEDIRMKEPAFFCKINGVHHHEGQEDRYLDLFSDAGDCKAVGEASTTYLTYPESAAWIQRVVPDAKVIVILRNPVGRAYSLYRWMVNHGHEWLTSFEAALEKEPDRRTDAEFFSGNPHTFYDYLYFESGLYSEQLARYFGVFPASQIKVILLDDLYRKPLETTREVYAFLGVDDSFEPEIKVHNKAEYRPASIRLHFLLSRLKHRYRHTRRGHLAEILFDLNISLFKLKWPKIDDAVRARLAEAYRSDIQATQRMTGKDLSAWLD